jgi:hypothetical protein
VVLLVLLPARLRAVFNAFTFAIDLKELALIAVFAVADLHTANILILVGEAWRSDLDHYELGVELVLLKRERGPNERL